MKLALIAEDGSVIIVTRDIEAALQEEEQSVLGAIEDAIEHAAADAWPPDGRYVPGYPL
jgi:hypothetical protein